MSMFAVSERYMSLIIISMRLTIEVHINVYVLIDLSHGIKKNILNRSRILLTKEQDKTQSRQLYFLQ